MNTRSPPLSSPLSSPHPSLRPSPRFCERFCIGLTGGIASGKSTVSAQLAHLGAAVVDTDVIAHTLTQAGGAAMPAIQAAFGSESINSDGSLNRPVMRERVFKDPAQRHVLEGLLHPMIHERTRALGKSTAGAYVVFVVPLLVESPRWRNQVDVIAVVDCDPAVQLARLLKRPGIDVAQAQRIMAAQASRAQRAAEADVLIDNCADTATLLAQVHALHQHWLDLAAKHPTESTTFCLKS